MTKTLVFVLDGYLRNIPMAVLYDGKAGKYLLEKPYGLAVLPTSRLFRLRTPSKTFNILAAGVSEAQQVENRSFQASEAREELAQVKSLAPTEILLNQQFTRSNLQASLRTGDFSILHLATHGNFSSDPENTY